MSARSRLPLAEPSSTVAAVALSTRGDLVVFVPSPGEIDATECAGTAQR